jgi:hypothetical protein
LLDLHDHSSEAHRSGVKPPIAFGRDSLLGHYFSRKYHNSPMPHAIGVRFNRSITLSIIDESSCAKRMFRAFIVQFRRASNICYAVTGILPRAFAANTHHLMRSHARTENAPSKQALVTPVR